VLGGVKRLVDGMYTVGLYTIVEVVVRGLHIRKKGPRDFAQRSTEPRCYTPLPLIPCLLLNSAKIPQAEEMLVM